MSPLEHRYRRLLQLLPETHRAARGEELLGLLLDLDDGRTRPSARQALGLIGLAIRLRLGNLSTPGNLLFGAFLVAYGTAQIGQFIDFYTAGEGFVAVGVMAGYRQFPVVLLASALAHLAVTMAWILGARYAAVVLQAAATAAIPVGYLLLTRHAVVADLLGMVSVGFMIELVLLCVLAVAARRRWPTPRPIVLWLPVVALGIVAWMTVGTGGRTGIYYLIPPPYISWVTAAIGAATAVFLLRQRRWPIVAVSALVGYGIGRLLPSSLLELAWLVSIAVAIFLLVGGAKLLTRLLSQPAAPATRKVTP